MNINNVKIGDRIMDDHGRVGIITAVIRKPVPVPGSEYQMEFDDPSAPVEAVMARPADMAHEVDSSGLVGMPGKVLTPTPWHWDCARGMLSGLWVDSPLNGWRTATVID